MIFCSRHCTSQFHVYISFYLYNICVSLILVFTLFFKTRQLEDQSDYLACVRTGFIPKCSHSMPCTSFLIERFSYWDSK